MNAHGKYIMSYPPLLITDLKISNNRAYPSCALDKVPSGHSVESVVFELSHEEMTVTNVETRLAEKAEALVTRPDGHSWWRERTNPSKLSFDLHTSHTLRYNHMCAQHTHTHITINNCSFKNF